MRKPVRRLAERLAIHYLDGHVGLGDRELGERFFGHPVETVRAMAIEHVGRALREKWGEHAPPDVVERAVALWTWREGRGELSGAEGAAFTLWPPAARFDVGWAVGALEQALEASGGEAQEGYRLLAWLPSAAEVNALGVISVLAHLVQSEEGPELAITSPSDVRAVLKAAVRAGGDALTVARETVNRLEVRTQIDFRDALNQDDEGEE